MTLTGNQLPPPRRLRPWSGLERRLRDVGISGRTLVIAAPALWLTVFFIIPLFVVFGISLATKQFGRPPYSPLLTTEGGTVQLTLHLSNYLKLFTDPLYVAAYLSSIRIAGIATVITLFIGYPMAYAIARAPDKWRNILLMLVILPFWTSFLLRVYALSGFMRGNGVINQVLAVFGIEPLVMMQTDFAVYVGLVYTYLPFMILPLYTTLVKLDESLLEASADLGARPLRTFLSITLPLSLPGVFAGMILVFVLCLGFYVTPQLLGGGNVVTISMKIQHNVAMYADWGAASALGVILLLAIALIPLVAKAMGAAYAWRMR